MSETRILVAEEDARVLASLCSALESHGYLIVGACNEGEGALSMARQLRPDLVLLDAHLPAVDGLAVAGMLHLDQLMPVVLMAGHGTRELVTAAREVGVLGYLVKPVKESELMPIIEVVRARWIEQHSRRQELSQLRDKLETRKVIERAKGYLMDSQGLQESEAFRKIQRLAMNSRKTMREVAQAILLAQQLRP